MKKEILMATTNPHKAERFKHYFSPLGLSVITFADLDVPISVVEDGKTPEENALKKAEAGYSATGKPTFGVDYWFYIKGLPEEKQPGPFVRRIFTEGGKKIEATDEEMLEYYSLIVEDLGGETQGRWVSAIALVTKKEKHTQSFDGNTILTSKVNDRRTEGEPLNSIQIDPATGKYFTDLTKDEWLSLQSEREKGYLEFMREHLDEI